MLAESLLSFAFKTTIVSLRILGVLDDTVNVSLVSYISFFLAAEAYDGNSDETKITLMHAIEALINILICSDFFCIILCYTSTDGTTHIFLQKGSITSF